jgi:putative protease
MTCTDADSVRLAASLGARRVVLARELSIPEIATIRNATGVEVEVFVHGALCVAYSGQCLTSEALGGRSANRGACAQACRLPYDLYVDGVRRELGARAYLLSPQDLEASALVPDLAAAGVTSLKIEGRLKGPEYVAAAAHLYRQAVDALALQGPRPELRAPRELALQTYSRGSGPGFLTGVDHQRLVPADTCEHRGLVVGRVVALGRKGDQDLLGVRLERAVSRGDGLVVAGGREGAGEIGGRVWGLYRGSEDGRVSEQQELLPAGRFGWIWLDPKRSVRGARVGRAVHRTHAPEAERAARALTGGAAQAALLVHARLDGVTGEPPALSLTAGGVTVTVTAEAPVEAARGRALDATALRARLDRLDDAALALGDVTCALPQGSFVPPSALNRARRKALEQLRAGLASAPAVNSPPALDPAPSPSPPSALASPSPTPASPPLPPGLFVLCRTREQADAALGAGADGVYLDFLELQGTGATFRALKEAGAVFVGVTPPRIRKPGEEKIDRYLLGLGPDALLVRSLGALASLSELPTAARPTLAIGDFSLNVTNHRSADEVLTRGLDGFTPAYDLDAAQLTALLARAGGRLAPRAEVVIHQPMPLFHMEHCVFAALLSKGTDHTTCGRPCERHALTLRDRSGLRHPVLADVGCRNTVFHAAAQSAASLLDELRAAGARRFRIELVTEDRARVAELVGAYREALAGTLGGKALRARLRTETGYGVVSGSLRVLPSG